MRVLGQAAIMTPEEHMHATEFVAWQLKVGDGSTNSDGISITLPPGIVPSVWLSITHYILELCLPDSDNDKLIDTVYPDLNSLSNLPENDQTTYFSERVILAAKNVDVDLLNEAALVRLANEEKTYRSADEAFEDGGTRDNSIP
jgi:hypothetical protein